MRNLSTFINRTVYGLKNRLYGHIAYLLPNWEVLLMLIFAISGCSTVKYIPVESKSEIVYRDTTYYQTDTLLLPLERIVEIVPQLDTLHMETSVAFADAYLDTTLVMLRGKIENKPQIELPVPVRTITRDSIIVKEVPVPVETEVTKVKIPKWAWATLSVCVFTLIRLLIKLWLKLKI